MTYPIRRLGAVLLWVAVALLLAPVVVPPFLDRIYYRGPVSGHFDGARFFNPDGEAGWSGGGFPAVRFARFLTGAGRTPWPEHVPVRPARPPARMAGRAMRVTWIGHATVLVQTEGLNILTDPLWSERTGPFGRGPRRVRAPGVRFEDLPRIDLVLVSHDHYDHLDVPTLRRLWQRDRPLIVTSLGNDAVIAQAGAPAVARDWGQSVTVRPGITVTVEPVHHWGSRWFADRDRALWSGFRIGLPGGDIVFAGDTGYGDGRWVDRMARGGPIRLAILPIGAFRPAELMQRNHIGPVQAVDIFSRLRATHALAVHWGTFQLADEGLDEAPALLRDTLRRRGIAAGRFRAPAPGIMWDIPALH